jgi:uncharacterized protein
MFSSESFHITAKPIGAVCNMSCSYCYFLSKQQTLGSSSKISAPVLEKFIKEYINSQKADTVFFTWHGGEPTLLGTDFFKNVVELQKKHCPSGKNVENDLQTNGLLINDEWCGFLKENRFLVGLSVDGDEEGNSCRVDNSGRSVLDKIINAAGLLKSYDIPFNTLTVVNSKNSQRPLDTYNFLKKTVGSNYMQFIPLTEVKNFANTAPLFWDEAKLPAQDDAKSVKEFVEGFSVSPEGWGNFLLGIFDEWYAKDQGKVFVYLFENFLSAWLGKGAQSCLFDGTCSHAMAMDRDGSVYACDHFSYPQYRYGNIKETPLADIITSEKRKGFASLKPSLPSACRKCRWLFACNGECPKKRFLKTKDGEKGLNYLCEGYKNFFEGISERMIELSVKYGNIR